MPDAASGAHDLIVSLDGLISLRDLGMAESDVAARPDWPPRNLNSNSDRDAGLSFANPVLRGLADGFPAPGLLAPSVLRVQAFLELPFLLPAFAAVVRWLDTGLYRAIARSALLPLASASYTAVFCLVEWDLRNPYTIDDIVLRGVSAVVTPCFLRWLAARDTEESRAPASVPGLLVFIGSLGTLGALVLVVYDTALLLHREV